MLSIILCGASTIGDAWADGIIAAPGADRDEFRAAKSDFKPINVGPNHLGNALSPQTTNPKGEATGAFSFAVSDLSESKNSGLSTQETSNLPAVTSGSTFPGFSFHGTTSDVLFDPTPKLGDHRREARSSSPITNNQALLGAQIRRSRFAPMSAGMGGGGGSSASGLTNSPTTGPGGNSGSSGNSSSGGNSGSSGPFDPPFPGPSNPPTAFSPPLIPGGSPGNGGNGPQTVPEPSSLVLLGLGGICSAIVSYRRRVRQTA